MPTSKDIMNPMLLWMKSRKENSNNNKPATKEEISKKSSIKEVLACTES
jgi:hypothetical protein